MKKPQSVTGSAAMVKMMLHPQQMFAIIQILPTLSLFPSLRQRVNTLSLFPSLRQRVNRSRLHIWEWLKEETEFSE